MNRRLHFPVALSVAAAIMLAACGSGSTAAKVSTEPRDTGAAGPQRPSNTSDGGAPVPQKLTLPTVDVLDTANDQKVAFANLLPAAKPVLFWFWAPH